MKRNIIFLDIDGVLNSDTTEYMYSEFHNGEENFSTSDYFFDPMSVKLINKLVKVSNSQIVISSSWRSDMEEVFSVFDKNGVNTNCILGKTPILKNCTRGEEIKSWIETYPEDVKEYICIDDENLYNPSQNLVLCNRKYGFTLRQYILSLHLLKVDTETELLESILLKDLINFG